MKQNEHGQYVDAIKRVQTTAQVEARERLFLLSQTKKPPGLTVEEHNYDLLCAMAECGRGDCSACGRRDQLIVRLNNGCVAMTCCGLKVEQRQAEQRVA
jgi:hypothetical protein